jgi:hypothetical protein
MQTFILITETTATERDADQHPDQEKKLEPRPMAPNAIQSLRECSWTASPGYCTAALPRIKPEARLAGSRPNRMPVVEATTAATTTRADGRWTG